MIEVEIRFDNDRVKVRRFGSGEFKRWTVLERGDADRLTGRSYDELRALGEGVWGFVDVAESSRLAPMMA